MDVMLIQFVQIKLVKGAYSMYFSSPMDIKYKDYMNQAADMARPYIREGWHLVHAMVIDYNV